jgi:hypothetical protein
MGKNRKDKVLEYLIFYLTIGIIFPVFKAYIRIPAFWPAIAMLICYAIMYYPHAFLKKSVLIVVIIILIFVLRGYNGSFEYLFDSNNGLLHYFYAYIVPVVIIELVITYNSKDFVIRLGHFSLLLLVISGVISIISEKYFPLVIRNVFGQSATVYPWWVITYSFGIINGLPVLIGLMVFTITKFYLHIVSLSVFVYVILIGGFFTALIFTVCAIGASMLIRFGVRKKYLYFFLTLFFLLINTFKFEVLNVAKYIPNEVAQEKVTGVESKLQTGEGSASTNSREEVYNASLNGFLDNFFFGGGPIGGHSYWLDKLSGFGIIGTLPFVLFILIISKRSLLFLPKHLRYVYSVILVITVVIMTFNPYEYLEFFTIVFVYAPIIGVYLYSCQPHFSMIRRFYRGSLYPNNKLQFNLSKGK